MHEAFAPTVSHPRRKRTAVAFPPTNPTHARAAAGSSRVGTTCFSLAQRPHERRRAASSARPNHALRQPRLRYCISITLCPLLLLGTVQGAAIPSRPALGRRWQQYQSASPPRRSACEQPAPASHCLSGAAGAASAASAARTASTASIASTASEHLPPASQLAHEAHRLFDALLTINTPQDAFLRVPSDELFGGQW